MFKLLIMNDLVRAGGAEKVMQEIVNYLSRGKYDITIATIVNDSENIKQLYNNNVKYMSLEKAFKGNNENIIAKIYYYIKKRIYRILYKLKFNIEKYDIVIAIKEGPVMQFLADVKAKKKFAWVHVDYNYLYWTKDIFKSKEDEIKCMQKYDNIVCVSEAARKSVCDVIGNPGNLVVKLNPINVEEIIQKSKQNIDVLEKYKIDKEKKILISVGGCRREKGYMRLLECCSKLNDYFDYELWIVGDGPEMNRMKSYIKQKNLNNVILWGSQENPYPFIKRSNWLISSSYGESYGLAIQEAFLLNVPVLATKCPAFEESISQEEGILVENTNEALYNGIYDILSNSELEKNKKSSLKKRTQEELYKERLGEFENLWKEKK